MSEHEQACLIIHDYAMDILEPRYGMKKSDFEHASFSLWAIDELLHELRIKRHLPPSTVIRNFARKMCRVCLNMKSDSRTAFIVAYNVVDDICDIFRAMEQKE